MLTIVLSSLTTLRSMAMDSSALLIGSLVVGIQMKLESGYFLMGRQFLKVLEDYTQVEALMMAQSSSIISTVLSQLQLGDSVAQYQTPRE